MNVQWYYSEGGQRRGPIPAEQLKSLIASGTIKPDTIVWKQGMAQWTPAGQVPELQQQEPPPLPDEPPPLPSPVRQGPPPVPPSVPPPPSLRPAPGPAAPSKPPVGTTSQAPRPAGPVHSLVSIRGALIALAVACGAGIAVMVAVVSGNSAGHRDSRDSTPTVQKPAPSPHGPIIVSPIMPGTRPDPQPAEPLKHEQLVDEAVSFYNANVGLHGPDRARRMALMHIGAGPGSAVESDFLKRIGQSDVRSNIPGLGAPKPEITSSAPALVPSAPAKAPANQPPAQPPAQAPAPELPPVQQQPKLAPEPYVPKPSRMANPLIPKTKTGGS